MPTVRTNDHPKMKAVNMRRKKWYGSGGKRKGAGRKRILPEEDSWTTKNVSSQTERLLVFIRERLSAEKFPNEPGKFIRWEDVLNYLCFEEIKRNKDLYEKK
jgi:hypothetical protein